MGLDMYLFAERHLSDYCKEDKPIIEQLKYFRIGGKPIQKITIEAAYWRKVNAIHKWFVDNIQKGVDNCGTYFVHTDDLSELLDTVETVLENKSIAHELLPTNGGFLFGGVDYDDWYFDGLVETKHQLKAILDNPEDYEGCEFYYHASW